MFGGWPGCASGLTEAWGRIRRQLPWWVPAGVQSWLFVRACHLSRTVAWAVVKRKTHLMGRPSLHCHLFTLGLNLYDVWFQLKVYAGHPLHLAPSSASAYPAYSPS